MRVFTVFQNISPSSDAAEIRGGAREVQTGPDPPLFQQLGHEIRTEMQ